MSWRKELAKRLVKILDADYNLIKHVADRPGHDFCYAVRWDKIAKLGWQPEADFETKLVETVKWYRDNHDWIENIMSRLPSDPADKSFFEQHYRHRR